MLCPFCNSENSKVVDKRDNRDQGVTRRRRECEDCGKRFTTYERVENINLYVIKRSGKIEEFDREKLKRGIMRAVKKRKLPDEQIEELVLGIEQTLLNHESTEIKAEEIGELVLEGLRKMDKVGYLLFASVYRDFQTIEDFKRAIKKIETQDE
ncbi:transcriptional repressor NrdR [Candidatus Dojkabacteria bacterium]|uniref:Transcriptional repressor NrdR n=1 Tax=Candidatus Dojkabacteria bacterium TaxID=2099670 RepID=A0A955KZC0_9BACT|nr:transcriptional repressor NrdR [Candidatus Dojkabacteria bacterium]